ncbi:MAG: hypothetical protein ACLGIA_04190 [Actinomycetes bacterium]
MTLLAEPATRERTGTRRRDERHAVVPDASHRSTEPRTDGARAAALTDRVGWTLAALVALFGAITAWSASVAVPAAALLAPALVLLSLSALWTIWNRPRVGRWVEVVVLGGTSAGVVLRAVQTVLTSPAYGTDALAFNEYAARLLLSGVNPYEASMAPALETYQVPPDFSTFRLDGSAVDGLSYPAGSVLAYLPAASLLPVHAGTVTNVLCWLLTAVLAWRMLPRSVSWAAPVLLGLSFYVDYAVGGVTDAVWLPLALVAVSRWDRFSDPTRAALARWAGPLALGAAMSVKQTPWFLAPFLLAGVVLEARDRGARPVRAGVRYVGGTAAAFAAVNVPFVVWDPLAWLSGSVLPLVESTVPDGQGVVSLAVYAGVGGGRLSLYGLLGALFVLTSLAAFVGTYPRLKRGWTLFVPLAFALPTRSLGSYLVMLVPVALVAACTVVPRVANRPRPGVPAAVRWGLVGLATVTGLVAVAALLARPPLALEVSGVRTTGAWQTVSEVTVSVANRTDHALSPTFTVNDNGRTTSFWSVSDRTPLQPHEHRSVTLVAPDTASMPAVSSGFKVLAFVEAPKAVASSPTYQPAELSVSLSPLAVQGPVPAGQEVVLTAQLRDRLGAPVARAGVPVSLSQVVYAQEALVPANTSVNGGPQGQSPVVAMTDAHGVATFRARGLQAQRDAVYYQAWVDGADAVPSGFSNNVLVRFVDSSKGAHRGRS